MDPRERINDPEESLRMALDGRLARAHTTFPCVVVSVDYEKRTAVLQPAIQAQVKDLQGVWQNVTITVLVDCPIIFPGGGGYSASFPVGEGDEVLALIAERCIDAWWQSGGVQPQAELRMHDLSDGFCFPRVWSQATLPPAFSSTTARLQKDDGTNYVEVGNGTINIVASSVINLKAPTINTLASNTLVLHAGVKMSQDANGYGFTWTWTGGNNWTILPYDTGANITGTPQPVDPPGPLP